MNSEAVNVLVVDDSHHHILALSALLEPLGERLLTAASGREALKQLLVHDVAVILLDVEMPGMGGFETARLIRQHPRSHDTPIIFVTAHLRSEANITEGYQLGAVDYIFKPLVPEVVRSKVAVFAQLFRQSVREHEHRRVLKELERSNEELRQFAYVVTHDLREPLRMVSSFNSLVAEEYGPQLDDKARRYIRYAVDGAKRMDMMLEALSTYNAVRTRAQPLAPIDAGIALGDALANLRLVLEETGARVDSDALPIVMADAGQLVQVFQNLIANAIKFKGEESPEVHVSAEQDEDGTWVFRVRDNGIGIEAEHRERIFEIFQRLHTQDAYPGTGIGLAVVRNIIDRHSGEVWLESQPGRGSTFFFTLEGA